MSDPLERALLLMQHDRPEEALPHLQQAAGEDPNDARPHAWMAVALCHLERGEEALAAARQAVHLEPEDASCHYALALALQSLDRVKEAHLAILEAIQLEPLESSHYAVQSQLYFTQSKWRQSLESANKGLACDPADTRCTNLRAMALRQLGETEDAAETLAGALADDPENPLTHANLGWNYLHRHQPKEALEAFREALRLDPTLAYARAGIVEALKARHPAYGLMLRLFVWLGRFPPGVQLGLVVGVVVGMQVLQSLAGRYPTLAPWTEPLAMCYLLFVFATWLASPLFDLLLFLDPMGRHALSRHQRQTALWLGVTLGGALLVSGWFLLVFKLTGHSITPWILLIPFLLAFPALTACGARPGWPRLLAIAYVAVMVAFLAIFVATGSGIYTWYLWGCVLASWLTHLLPRHDDLD